MEDFFESDFFQNMCKNKLMYDLKYELSPLIEKWFDKVLENNTLFIFDEPCKGDFYDIFAIGKVDGMIVGETITGAEKHIGGTRHTLGTYPLSDLLAMYDAHKKLKAGEGHFDDSRDYSSVKFRLEIG